NIDFATISEHGGAACAVVKSCMGNGLGFKFNKNSDLFSPLLGTIIISAKDIQKLDGFENVYIGETLPEGEDYYFDNEQIYREQAQSAWSLTLEKIFPLNAEAAKEAENINYVKKASEIIICPDKFARPNVFLPIFPGTNCEYDTAKRFLEQGAKVTVFVVKNLSPQEIEQSVEIIAKYIDQSQITVFSGGFSGGDEPDGSGKFIATTIRNPRICESITKLYKQRKGLILGICNGFQALIKMGLLPYGEFTPQNSDSPTLTFNNISRHISSLCQIRVASDKSPWLYGVNTGEVYTVPVSHGEGRFYCNKQQIEQMINNGQIATQYADFEGNAAVARPFNPNGSYYAVEGITSPCGRIFGKMGHTERYENNLYKNIDGRFDMKVFESGIKYFK
ncbi:MAG: phosphoribosylformylglycinamidine synthase subunit PurQ, partial [Clostridia bacterium]|nr:phosphoribosylformylglycinamidine synthase subunit PurQ [Clostridia bacterium]